MTVMLNCSPAELPGMRRTSSLAESAAVPSTMRPLLASTFTLVVTLAPLSRAGTGSNRVSCGGADGSVSSCASDTEGVSKVKASTTRTAALNEEYLDTAAKVLQAGMAGLLCEKNVEFRDGLVAQNAQIVHPILPASAKCSRSSGFGSLRSRVCQSRSSSHILDVRRIVAWCGTPMQV